MSLLSIIPSLHFGWVWFSQPVERATSPLLEGLALWRDSPGYTAYAWWFWLAGWRPSEHKPCLFWCQCCQGMVGGAAQLEGSILRASLMGTNEIDTDREQMGLGRLSRKILPPQLLALYLHYSLGRLSRMEWLASHPQCTPRHGPQQSPTCDHYLHAQSAAASQARYALHPPVLHLQCSFRPIPRPQCSPCPRGHWLPVQVCDAAAQACSNTWIQGSPTSIATGLAPV